MIIVVLGAILNIILDAIFIFLFDLGVRGAAIATVMSQGICAIFILKYLINRKHLIFLKIFNVQIDAKVIKSR